MCHPPLNFVCNCEERTSPTLYLININLNDLLNADFIASVRNSNCTKSYKLLNENCIKKKSLVDLRGYINDQVAFLPFSYEIQTIIFGFLHNADRFCVKATIPEIDFGNKDLWHIEDLYLYRNVMMFNGNEYLVTNDVGLPWVCVNTDGTIENVQLHEDTVKYRGNTNLKKFDFYDLPLHGWFYGSGEFMQKLAPLFNLNLGERRSLLIAALDKFFPNFPIFIEYHNIKPKMPITKFRAYYIVYNFLGNEIGIPNFKIWSDSKMKMIELKDKVAREFLMLAYNYTYTPWVVEKVVLQTKLTETSFVPLVAKLIPNDLLLSQFEQKKFDCERVYLEKLELEKEVQDQKHKLLIDKRRYELMKELKEVEGGYVDIESVSDEEELLDKIQKKKEKVATSKFYRKFTSLYRTKPVGQGRSFPTVIGKSKFLVSKSFTREESESKSEEANDANYIEHETIVKNLESEIKLLKVDLEHKNESFEILNNSQKTKLDELHKIESDNENIRIFTEEKNKKRKEGQRKTKIYSVKDIVTKTTNRPEVINAREKIIDDYHLDTKTVDFRKISSNNDFKLDHFKKDLLNDYIEYQRYKHSIRVKHFYRDLIYSKSNLLPKEMTKREKMYICRKRCDYLIDANTNNEHVVKKQRFIDPAKLDFKRIPSQGNYTHFGVIAHYDEFFNNIKKTCFYSASQTSTIIECLKKHKEFKNFRNLSKILKNDYDLNISTRLLKNIVIDLLSDSS
jgi:hypothetical protein